MLTRLEYVVMIKNTINSHHIYTKTQVDASHNTYAQCGCILRRFA